MFRATIVESYEVFWTDIVSNKVWVVSDNDTDDNEVENEKSISDKKTSYYNYKLGDGDYDLDVDNLTDFVQIFQDDTRFSEDVDIGDQDKQINHDNLPLTSNQVQILH